MRIYIYMHRSRSISISRYVDDRHLDLHVKSEREYSYSYSGRQIYCSKTFAMSLARINLLSFNNNMILYSTASVHTNAIAIEIGTRIERKREKRESEKVSFHFRQNFICLACVDAWREQDNQNTYREQR